ncbi:ribose 5-phosphate isomerase [uncultured Roseburia sp.]|uniref:RpiB/LacA/LacB family sugar-phosphate isomerase n=1 Tax=Brotonthovivens ammoniilytica TaxID=2981725 RepID=A0ABT2TFV3_9FIRM|nr:RpiB/LacA/LacB family sugar-phosphate isomerase [Brotonthovivens ammoniilytica]MCU6761073.1 RpiB/LacA/LacB family sugar-phosphate isomerase [Brotonthovivens ammoniilytica]SCI18106.1 ribose 5-phosphate isomerase [uncultured Roseburia sp.]
MKIALVMEWSTCERNEIVYQTLKKAAQANGHTVVNYGQFDMEDHRQTYNQNAVLTAAILNSGAADFVITGCGTGEGAMLAANAMPGVCCGFVVDPADSYLFTQVNGGNCMSLPFAKGWGWGAEINLEYVFEKLFAKEPGGGYPEHAAASEQRNAALLNKLKAASHHSLEEILSSKDADVKEMIREAFAGKRLELFEADCKCPEILAAVKKALA